MYDKIIISNYDGTISEYDPDELEISDDEDDVSAITVIATGEIIYAKQRTPS